MAIGDPISDMLTRMRNALRNKAKSVVCRNSNVVRGVATVLRDEGYIDGFDLVEDGRSGMLNIRMKYSNTGEPALHRLTRESKPGRRVYRGVDELPRPLQGLGISIVSTSRGIMSDRKAREMRVGGEVVATVC